MEQITPVFIIGAARNGTTSLTNLISRFPEFAGIEHELHRGNHEAKLYSSYKYYGNFTDPNKYLDFIYHYSSGDYFQLAEGNIEYHLKNPKSNFFEFYFDMMNQYCIKNHKKYWLAKIDASFFTDHKVLELFLKTLHEFYGEIKYIKIQRNFEEALLSAVYMPGKDYHKSKSGIYRYYRLLSYTQQWFKTYIIKQDFINKTELLFIDFNDLIKNKEGIIIKMREFLNLSTQFEPKISKSYSINTSFSKTAKFKLSRFDKFICINYLKFLKLFPNFIFFTQIFYFTSLKKSPSIPISRRLLKYKFFKKNLQNEFTKLGSFGLADKLKKELEQLKSHKNI